MKTFTETFSRHVHVQAVLRKEFIGLDPGSRIEPERPLALRLGVSRLTLRKAIQQLCEEGILEARQGSGTFIRRKIEPPVELESPGRVKLIALHVPNVGSSSMMARIVSGAEQRAAELGYHLVIRYHHQNPDLQIEALRRVLQDRLDAVVIYPCTANINRPAFRDLLQEISAQQTCVVLIDRCLPGMRLPCVLTDNMQGMYDATAHLIRQGRKKLALLSFDPQTNTAVSRERREGFRAALADHGLDPEPVCLAELGVFDQDRNAFDAVTRWVNKPGPSRFDAVVCMEDEMAFGAYNALTAAGLRVPEDVALVGFDNLDRAVYRAAGLELTSVDQPCELIGGEAVSKAVRALTGDSADGQFERMLLHPHLKVRGSCGSQPDSAEPALPVSDFARVSY